MFCVPGPGDATPLFEKSGNKPKAAPSSARGETSSAKRSPRANPRPATRPEDPRKLLGDLGESRAASFLARRGYRIDARNVRYDGVEIDLIVRRGATVVFVEVKTRRSTRYGAPELAVDRRKQARMVRAASAWLHQHRGVARKIRFDVVACTVEQNCGRERWKIDHWIDAFDAGG